jgi:hypothetical protein
VDSAGRGDPGVDGLMAVKSCIPIVPSVDLERSLRLWREGLGFDETWWEQHRDGKLVGCGIRKGHMSVMLNTRAGTPEKPETYEGVRFYWAPDDLEGLRERLLGLGFAVSELWHRDYGQSEFVLTDDDGFDHCFGVPTDTLEVQE